jgi:outer membrane lipoprotein LolB
MRATAEGMILRPRSRGRALLPAVALLPLLLGACAGMRTAAQPLPPEAQETLLRELPRFSLRGKTGIVTTDPATGEKSGPPGASLNWEQEPEEATFKLSGPFGAGNLTVTWRPDGLRLAAGRDEVFVGEEAEQVLINEIGFVPPFESLRYWILGLEAPGESPTQRKVAESGRVSEMTQQQWRIRYTDWRKVRARGGTVELPRKLAVTRDNLSLKLTIYRWKL